MTQLTLTDEAGAFAVTCLSAERPIAAVLFAVGGGGDPSRHQPLLESLTKAGVSVVAPHFERIHAPRATAEELTLRARRLRLALQAIGNDALPVAGIGHSLGGALLLALAGARMWLGPGRPLSIEPEPRLARLALLAPATGFFMAPGALEHVRLPILALGASEDTVTPPAQIEFLRSELALRAPIEARIVKGAGHFSFMHRPPPNVTEPMTDHGAFLAGLSDELAAFVLP